MTISNPCSEIVIRFFPVVYPPTSAVQRIDFYLQNNPHNIALTLLKNQINLKNHSR
jgi:hypothetical protein